MNYYQQTQKAEDFIQAVWKDENGEAIVLDPLHYLWLDFIDKMRAKGHKRLGILAPYKYGKTPNILGYALHELCLNKNLRCKFVCNDDFNAKKRVATVKKYIEQDEEFKALYGSEIVPNKRGFWTMHAIEVQRDSFSTDASFESAGLFVTGVGGTFDLIVFDDVCDLNNSILSPARRESAKLAVNDLWLSRLEPQGVALYIGTTWHEQDITHELLDRPGWVWLLMRVKKDFTGLEYVIYENN